MVEQLCPPGTEVLKLGSFDEARRVLLECPPDAAVVTVGPAHLPWREFQQLCAGHTPPVPVLYESCVFSSAEEAGLEQDQGHALFLRTPAPMADLEGAMARLLNAAREAKSHLGLSESGAKTA